MSVVPVVPVPVPVPVPSARPAELRPVDPHEHRDPDSDSDGSRKVEVLRIVAWTDPVIDRLGYDPRSIYVETFWLGILGPTCTWLMRRLRHRARRQSRWLRPRPGRHGPRPRVG